MRLLKVTPDVIIAPTWPQPIRRESLRGDLTPNAFRRDFAPRLAYAEDIKAAMRRSYARTRGGVQHAPGCHPGDDAAGCQVSRSQDRSFAFWSEYEEINVRYLPEDPTFSKTSTGVTLTTTNSLWQLLAGATGQMRILESFLGGEAAASAVLRFAVARSAIGVGAAPATYTPEKFNTRSAAAVTTAYGAVGAQVAWATTQETLNNPLFLHAFNAFGGTDRFIANPGEEVYLVNGEYASGRSLSGVPIVSAHVIFEEL